MNLTIFQKGVILTAIPLVSQLIFTLMVAYSNQQMTSFLAEEERPQPERVARLEALQGAQLALLFAGSFAACVVTVMLALMFSRGIGGRLQSLSQNVQLPGGRGRNCPPPR